MTEEEKFITIKEFPLYGYTNVVEKISKGVITKIIKRQGVLPGVYRLRKQVSNKKFKLLDEHIEIISSTKTLWIRIGNSGAKEILGATSKPLFGNYLNDLSKMLHASFMKFENIPIVNVIEFRYIKKPVQMRLEV